jgi:hypothetical protein
MIGGVLVETADPLETHRATGGKITSSAATRISPKPSMKRRIMLVALSAGSMVLLAV